MPFSLRTSFLHLILLGTLIPFTLCDLPSDDMPDQIANTCSVDNDCHTYMHAHCNGGTCSGCNSNTQCTRFYSPGTCTSGNCIIPCTNSNQDICREKRTRCSGGQCEQCYVDGDCVGYPGTIYCLFNEVEINLCVNCRTNADCDASAGMTCQFYKCVQCTTDNDCPRTTPHCLFKFEENVCKECLEDAHCTSASSPKCSSSYTCTGCSIADERSHISGKPICSSGTCVECTVDSDCIDPAKSVCDTGSNMCVPCSNHAQCNHLTPDTYCYGGTCINAECTTIDECTNPLKSNCNMGTKFCEMCTIGSTQCSHITATPLCAGSPSGCVQCLSSTDCTNTATSVCNAGSCQRCITDPDCNNFSLKPVCDTSIGCVECVSNPICTNPLKSWCNSNTCQLCTADPQCSHLIATPRCSGTSSGCVECMSNSDCMTTAKSHCYPSLNVCQSCSIDSHCIHIPNMNKCWHGECVIYSPVCIPSHTVTIVQQASLNDFLITFDLDLVIKIDILSTIKIQLVGVESTDYSFTITQVTDQGFKINFQVAKTIPKTKIEVEVPCPTSSGYVYGNITQEIDTNKIPFGSADLKAAVETLGTVASTATSAVGGISGAMLFLGANPAILWGLLGSIQTFYYMIFINIDYPLNVQAFFPIFAVGNLDFIPNPMWIIFPNIADFSLPVPARFAEHDVDGLFLANAGNMILLWLGNIALYVFSFLIMKYTRNMQKVLGIVCSKAVETFEWSGTIRVFITSYMDLTTAAFLQLRVLSWDSGLFTASSVCGLLFGTFGVMLPILTYKIVERYDTKPKLIKHKFGTLIEDYKLNDDIHKYFTVISIGRNLILAASLVYLHDYPYIEIITLTTLRFSFAYLDQIQAI